MQDLRAKNALFVLNAPGFGKYLQTGIRGFLWSAAVYGLEFEEIYYILAGVSVGDIVLRLEYLSGHIWDGF